MSRPFAEICMIRHVSALVVIGSDSAIPAEPLRALLAAIEGLLRDAVVDSVDVGRQTAASWLLPSLVTILFRPGSLACGELQELRSFEQPFRAALAALYRRLDATGRAGNAMPLSVEFRRHPSELFRFVFGDGLAIPAVEHALGLVPTVLREAEGRLARSGRLFDLIATDEVPPEGHGVELIHLYADPSRGWEILA
jgi:hypothetical protein